jgi:hypothetical protein
MCRTNHPRRKSSSKERLIPSPSRLTCKPGLDRPRFAIKEVASNGKAAIAHVRDSSVELYVSPVVTPCTARNFTNTSLAYFNRQRAAAYGEQLGSKFQGRKEVAAQ